MSLFIPPHLQQRTAARDLRGELLRDAVDLHLHLVVSQETTGLVAAIRACGAVDIRPPRLEHQVCERLPVGLQAPILAEKRRARYPVPPLPKAPLCDGFRGGVREKGSQKIGDDISSEFRGIINYAVIGSIQLELPAGAPEELPVDKIEQLYESHTNIAKKLMQDKNHDYGEAWRSMSQESFTDLILMKLQRIRQILMNDGKTIMSEGIDANYLDILNYAVFALILLTGTDNNKLSSESLVSR